MKDEKNHGAGLAAVVNDTSVVTPERQAANRAELRRRIAERAEFDYRVAYERCGCAIPEMDEICGADVFNDQFYDFRQFGFTSDEDAFVTGLEAQLIDPTAKHWGDMTAAEATGEAGKAECLRRLDLVEQRIKEREARS